MKNYFLERAREVKAVAYFKINNGNPVEFWKSDAYDPQNAIPPTLTLTLQPGGCLTFTDEQGNEFKLYVQAEK
jgi:hypothetical protein